MICALCGKCHNSTTQSEKHAACAACVRSIASGRDRVVGGMLVRPAFEHAGAMRTFVHRMKYHDAPVPESLIRAMADRLPEGIDALVPVPRSHARRFRYGCDPAWTLAERLSRRTGVRAVAALGHPVLARRHAGRSARQRSDPHFRAVRPVWGRLALVDDVVTTGRTLVAAADALGASRTRVALTLTSSD